MNKIILCLSLISLNLFADISGSDLHNDIIVVEQDLIKTGFDVWVLLGDAKICLYNNIPSSGTLTVDGAVDSFLRQYQPIAVAIKALEQKNPVNGAIVRDFSKAMTVSFKIYYELPVDLSGRQYDRADLYAQMTKFMSKVAGFSALYLAGGIASPVMLFIVNNGGDVLSQGVLDAGKDWRKNQTDSFENYILENYSVKKSIFSIPAKGTVSYATGWVIQNLNLAQAAELATLVILSQATKDKNTIILPEKLSFKAGFMTSFVTSVLKSLILTTTCKSAVDTTNYYLSGLKFSG